MKYSKSHEWVQVNGSRARVGLSKHGAKELGKIVYVELPEKGRLLKAGEEAAVLESTKAAADYCAPLSGTVVKVNEQLGVSSESLNSSPEERGWLFELELTDLGELDDLLTQSEYSDLIHS